MFEVVPPVKNGFIGTAARNKNRGFGEQHELCKQLASGLPSSSATAQAGSTSVTTSAFKVSSKGYNKSLIKAISEQNPNFGLDPEQSKVEDQQIDLYKRAVAEMQTNSILESFDSSAS